MESFFTKLNAYCLTLVVYATASGKKFHNRISYTCNDLPMKLLYWFAPLATDLSLDLFNVEKSLVVSVTELFLIARCQIPSILPLIRLFVYTSL